MDPEPADPISTLSPRQREAFLGIARGDTNHEIAARMGVSVKTVDSHRMRVMEKLEFSNNVKLALFAVRHGLVTP